MSFISVFAYSILSGRDGTAQAPRAFPIGRFAVEDTTGKEQSMHEARSPGVLEPMLPKKSHRNEKPMYCS